MTESVSLCERMKSWLRLLDLNRRFEPLRIVLTSWLNFLQTRRR